MKLVISSLIIGFMLLADTFTVILISTMGNPVNNNHVLISSQTNINEAHDTGNIVAEEVKGVSVDNTNTSTPLTITLDYKGNQYKESH